MAGSEKQSQRDSSYTDRTMATRVGSFDEVVRHIVLYLDTSDFARARRVSKTWKAEVENWRQWREWLFQVPAANWEHLLWEHEEGDFDKWHVELKMNLPDADLPFDDNLFSLVIELHPLLADHPGVPLHEPCMPWLMFVGNDRERLSMIDTTHWTPAYLTQPPVTWILISWAPVFDQGPFRKSKLTLSCLQPLDNNMGILLQDVLQAIRTGPVFIPTHEERFAAHQLDAFNSHLEAGQSSVPGRPLTIAQYTQSYGPPIADSFLIEFPSCILRKHFLTKAIMKSETKTATWCHDRFYTLVSKDPLVYEPKPEIGLVS